MGGGKLEGRITAITQRASSRIVGRYEETRRGAIVIPEETRLNLVVAIPPTGRGKAEDGHQVVVELTGYPVGGRPAEGRVVEVLGWPDDPEVEVQSAIRRFDLPHIFDKETLAEAEAVADTVSKDELKGRVDLRSMPTVTIDGETARDFDDAVSLRREGDNRRLWVSIADVSHYVKPGSAPGSRGPICAAPRSTSRTAASPCCPSGSVTGSAPLNPQVDRLTMTAEMLFDKNGNLVESSFYPSMIKSSARLTYTFVKQVIVDNDPEALDKQRPLIPMLLEMKELALILQAMRKKRGSIDFDLPEPEIIIGLTGQTEGIIRAERKPGPPADRGVHAGRQRGGGKLYHRAREIPFLYRIHENPDPAKLINFQEFVYGFGYEFPLQDERVNPADLQRLLVQAEGRPEERMLNYALLRCMKQARYAAENLGHFGLASKCYCHFTSPIRRYPDLVVHRILRAALATGVDSAQPAHTTAQPAERPLSGAEGKRANKQLALATQHLGEIAEQTSKRERVAMEAERDVVELKKVQFMQRHLGEEFDGFITGVTGFGFFVELEELFVEGLVHITTLDDDLYSYPGETTLPDRVATTSRSSVSATRPGCGWRRSCRPRAGSSLS